MRRLFLTAAALILTAPAVLGAAEVEGLDGSAWMMKESSLAGIVLFWRSDRLSFAGGQFDSASCRPYGFGPAAFTATRSGEATAWTATAANAKGEKMVWEGRRDGGRMEGTYTFVRADGKMDIVAWKAKQLKTPR